MAHRRLPALDGLRGLAVLLVFSLHVGGGAHSSFLPLRVIGEICNQGWTGVTLFFILSGFLITGILWDSRGEPHWWRNFYTRRMLRIFPLYYGSLLAVLVAAALAGTFSIALSRIWSPLLFLQDIPGRAAACINYDGSPLQLSHFWSLAVEEQFYIVWPFLLLLPKTKRAALSLCTVIFVLSELLLLSHWTRLGIEQHLPLVFTRAAEMAAGAWLAIAYRTRLWNHLRRPAQFAAVLGLALFILGAYSGYARFGPLCLPAITLCYAALLVLSLHQGLVGRALSTRLIRWIGTISYGIYVYHVLLGHLFETAAVRIAGSAQGDLFHLVLIAISTIGTLLISWLSFQYFERPFLRRKRYYPTAGAVDSAPAH
ncbi:MAG TPA: acyltransferase [Acidobacteriaceae bacterium]|jgi:peptidoglycan/LPS O-acetylase OafA/YrhL|nr:acyltransferase [Acidobacteriaceae bacterium]